MEVLMPSTMNIDAAIGYAERLYAGDYRHWCAPRGWCREAAMLLLRAFGNEAKAYHYEMQHQPCRRANCYNDEPIPHVVVVYRDRVFDLTRAQFGKGLKRIIGDDVSILEGLYGEPTCINQDTYPDWTLTGSEIAEVA